MKIAVLGGSFNPVHNGHLALAEDVHLSLGYDRVLLVPTNIPPHKDFSDGLSSAHRLAMLTEVCADASPWLSVSSCEIERGGVSYTIDTLKYLSETIVHEGNIGLIFGDDLLTNFCNWHRCEDIILLADIIIARREHCDPSAGVVVDEKMQKISHSFTYLENPVLPISSTEVRKRIASGKSYRYLVPGSVYRYIIEHGLYGSI